MARAPGNCGSNCACLDVHPFRCAASNSVTLPRRWTHAFEHYPRPRGRRVWAADCPLCGTVDGLYIEEMAAGPETGTAQMAAFCGCEAGDVLDEIAPYWTANRYTPGQPVEGPTPIRELFKARGDGTALEPRPS